MSYSAMLDVQIASRETDKQAHKKRLHPQRMQSFFVPLAQMIIDASPT